MRKFLFTPTALAQFNAWEKADKKIYNKIVDLLQATQTSPFNGIGKPEPLKHQLKGCWSRRINKEHCLVYQISPDTIVVISCKFHY